ncbi:hypothetical protein [Paraflavitalea pollutisoli]|uniref:hypothetical protein n=1 Tax=Paraflavitalea pollutisoli TaxID=3034143 RepID=UPI0023EABC82|nr:hypothetical protein [Paraflavitalea sp. H1-2-19X]
MKKVFLLTSLLATLVFTSCKKDKDNGNDNPGGGGGNPGTTKLLKKTTETENGVTTVFNFNYDNNKRLTSYASADGKDKTAFTYDAAGNLTKIEITDEDSKTVFTYTYANNIPVSGTMKSWEMNGTTVGDLDMDSELTFTVVNGQVTKIVRLIKGEDAEENLTLNLALTYTNGNLTKVETTAGSDYAYNATFTFGDKKSPFPQLTKYVLDEAGFSLMISSKNDLKTAAYVTPGMGQYGFTNTYTYDASGYPLTSTDGQATVKYEYQ